MGEKTEFTKKTATKLPQYLLLKYDGDIQDSKAFITMSMLSLKIIF